MIYHLSPSMQFVSIAFFSPTTLLKIILPFDNCQDRNLERAKSASLCAHTREAWEPCDNKLVSNNKTFQQENHKKEKNPPSNELRARTAIDIILHSRLNLARVHGGRLLRFQRVPVLAGVEHAARVHGALQGVVLPAEHVVRVGPEPLVVAVAQDERLRPVRRPRQVVELRRVPERFVGYLRDSDYGGGS